MILFIFLIALGGGENDPTTANNSNETEEKEYRFADRPDKQEVDVEVLPDEAADVEGMKMTATDVRYTASISDFETAGSGKEYVVVNVSLENTSDEVKSYNPFYYRVQTAGGQVLDPALTTSDNDLSSGDLVAGGKVSGTVTFEVPKESGHQYLLWTPPYSSQRGVVQIK